MATQDRGSAPSDEDDVTTKDYVDTVIQPLVITDGSPVPGGTPPCFVVRLDS